MDDQIWEKQVSKQSQREAYTIKGILTFVRSQFVQLFQLIIMKGSITLQSKIMFILGPPCKPPNHSQLSLYIIFNSPIHLQTCYFYCQLLLLLVTINPILENQYLPFINISVSIFPTKKKILYSGSTCSDLGVGEQMVGVFQVEYIRYMATFMVSATNADERTRLQQQFSMSGDCFEVRADGTATLEAILRTMSFQYFQNNPPSLAHKVLTFAENMLSGHCSLSLLREIIGKIKKLEDLVSTQMGYFKAMGIQIGGECLSEEAVLSECSAGEENDHLFQLAQRGETRMTRSIDPTDFHQTFENSLKRRTPITISEKTQLPSVLRPNPEERQPRDTLENSAKISHIFYTAEAYYGSDWWKQQRNDSSKEISKFDCKAKNPFNQKSIGKLVREQIKHDLNREIELGKELNKHQVGDGVKYRKMMKDKLLSAKLKKKKKK